MQKYPIRFYGRTLIFRVGVLLFGPLGALLCIMGLLFFLGIEEPIVDGRDDYEVGIDLTITGLLFLIPAGICAFQVFARQTPTLIICKEGLWIRSIRILRIRSVRFRWENVDVMPKQAGLTIAGRIDKENRYDFESDTSFERRTFFYWIYSFREPFDKVIESVQFYLHNPDSREMLPSWQDDDIVSDRFTVYND